MGDTVRDGLQSSDEDGVTDPTSLLHPLADELLTIAARLRGAATSPGTGEGAAPSARLRHGGVANAHLSLARKLYALRRKRTAIFSNPDLFGEPAWDILLDLYIAHGEGKPVSVSSACIGSAAPATTGLRWLGILADEGCWCARTMPTTTAVCWCALRQRVSRRWSGSSMPRRMPSARPSPDQQRPPKQPRPA